MNVKKKWTIPVLFLSLFSPVFNGYGQKPDKPGGKPETPDLYKVPNTGSASISTCSGTVYDNGGTGNYADNSNGVLTILPGTKNKSVQLDFTSFDLEPYYDYLEVYNGNSTSAPLLGVFFNNPGKVTATNESGALTLKFFSDGSVNKSGFAATISCVTKVVSSNSKPDLFADGLAIIQNELVSGRNFTAEFKIKNAGDAVASQSNTGYYLSQDLKLSSGDKFLGAEVVPSVAAGASVSVKTDLNIPEGTATGDYYIIAVADYDNKINERRENNNISSLAIKIVPEFSDVYVSSVSLQQTEVLQNSYLTVSAIFGNKGNSIPVNVSGVAYLSADAVVDASDYLLGSLPFIYLPAGKDSSYYISGYVPENFPAGDYYVLTVVDPDNQISEPNEFNNTGITKTTVKVVPGFADLIPSLYTNSSSVYAGNYLYLTAYMHNGGNKLANEIYAGYYLSSDNVIDSTDILLGEEFTQYIYPGSYNRYDKYLFIPANIKGGTYNLIYKADINDQVTESNEQNNIAIAGIEILDYLPDLSIGNISLPSSEISLNSKVPVSFTNFNTGSGIAYNFKSSVYLSADSTLDVADILVGQDSTGYLYYFSSEYKNSELTIPSGINTGSYYLLFAIDSESSVDEINEGNNITAYGINIAPVSLNQVVPSTGNMSVTTCGGKVFDHAGTGYYSNYVDGTLTIYPEVAGNKIKLDFTAFELETCCDYLAIYDGSSTDSRLIEYFRYNPGTVYATNESGALTLRFHSDGSIVYQGFEAEISCIESVPYPDLSINSIGLSDSVITPQSYFTVGLVVENTGNVRSNPNYAALYLSSDSVYDSSDILLNSVFVPSVSVGDSVNVAISAYIQEGNLTGNYNLIAKIDYSGNVNESDESNNEASVGIKINPLPYDLVISDVYASDSAAGLGANVWVSYYLQNNSGYYVPSVKTGMYLSADSLLDTGDIFLNYSEKYSLYPYDGNQIGAGITIPDSIQTGSYYVLFAADYDNLYTETAETNNFASLRLEVVEPTVDFTFNYLIVPDSAIYPGNQTYVQVYIDNKGSIRSNTGSVNFYLSKDNIVDSTDAMIGSFNTSIGQSFPEVYGVYTIIPATADTGKYYLIGQIDAYNEIAETDENNNQLSAEVYVYPASRDLSVSDLVISGFPHSGGYLLGNYTLHNNGAMPTSGFYTYFYLSQDAVLDSNDTYLTYNYMWNMSGHESVSQSLGLYLPPDLSYGNYNIIASADYYNYIAEDDETNNTTSAVITVEPSKVDFVLSDIRIADSLFKPGSAVVQFAVENSGNDLGYLYTGYYLSADTILDASDRVLKEEFTDYVYAGSKRGFYSYIYIPQDVEDGRYYVILKSDYSEIYSEDNESDNISFAPFNVISAVYDLSFAQVSGVSGAAGQLADLTYTISNYGNKNEFGAYAGLYISEDNVLDLNDYYLGDNYFYVNNSGIANVQTQIFIPYKLQSGNYKLLLIADPGGNLPETDELNNMYVADLIVYDSQSDLIASQLQLSSDVVISGSSVDLSYLVSSTFPGGVYSEYGFYLSADDSLESSDRLIAGDAFTIFSDTLQDFRYFRIYFDSVPAGNYKLFLKADPNDYLIETNEFNNVLVADITVIASDSAFARSGEVSSSASAEVYPNPTEGQFTLNIKNVNNEISALANITIYNAAGHVIESRTETVSASGFSSSFDLAGFAKGIYAVKVELNGKVETHKVVVE
jgi:trimeric autotransporter adhesin